MSEVSFSTFAESDLESISDYFLKFSINSARRFLKDLMQKFRMLADNPQIGRAHDEYLVNLRSFPYKDYVIFYFPNENGIEIYRVLHGARDIESLFEDYFEGLKP